MNFLMFCSAPGSTTGNHYTHNHSALQAFAANFRLCSQIALIFDPKTLRFTLQTT